jgi:hypothetical protein
MVRMTSGLVTPWWRARTPRAGGAAGSIEPTAILDWRHPLVGELVQLVREHEPVTLLRRAHGLIAHAVRPVYSVNDTQPVSRTLRRGRGSCSQRLAVLEAVARASGIPTRARGLLVSGTFWYPRFPRLRFLVPRTVVLAWPEFQLDGWIPAGELFGVGCGGFANTGETLFDTLAHNGIDWDGCDLSATVDTDLGRFSSRDDLFAAHGQTLCPGIRIMAEPVLSRWSPGSRTSN